MKRVVIESPLSGNFERNRRYALWCERDSFNRGEAPFLSHVFYTQVLDDENPDERRRGMQAGFAWGEVADLRVLYVDLGTSSGMADGLAEAVRLGQEHTTRVLPPEMFEAFQRGEYPKATRAFESCTDGRSP